MKNYFDKLDYRVSHYKKEYANSPRMVAMKLMWWNLKCMLKKQKGVYRKADDKRIAIAVNGGIGDYLQDVNYALYLYNYLDKEVPIDIFVKNSKDFSDFVGKAAPFVYYDRNSIHEASGYAVKININRFPEILYYNEQFIDLYIPKFKKVLQAALLLKRTASMYFDLDPRADALTVKYAKINGACKRIQQPDLDSILGIQEEPILQLIPDQIHCLNKFHLSDTPFITLNRGTDAGNSFSEVTRMWPVEYYDELVEKIKHKYPNYKIVQLGYSKTWCKEIKGIDIDLRGKTTLSDLKNILYYSSLHIDYEGGMVHLRKVLNTGKSIVLFGSTDPSWLGYASNINLCTNKCQFCENLHDSWQKICSNHKAPHICMKSLTPDMVFKAIDEYLTEESVVQSTTENKGV